MAHGGLGLDEDELLATYATDDPEPGDGQNRRFRMAMAGPLDVGFYTFAHKAPGASETVWLTGTLPELERGVQMQPCETGGRRIWRCTVQINTVALLAAGAQPASGTSGAGGLGNLGAGQGPLFQVQYELRNSKGSVLQKSESASQEFGQIRPYYYHRALFPGDKATPTQSEAFGLFVHEEIHRLQTDRNTSLRDYTTRFLHLVQSPFAKKRQLMDKALEELITVHWGQDVQPPAQTVLAIAASVGYFRKQAQHGPSSAHYDDHGDGSASAAHDPAASEKGDKDQRGLQAPLSLVICRWIVRYCPQKQDIEDEERALREQARQDTPQQHWGPQGHQLQRYVQMGVQQVADTLYSGEKTFEWLPLIHFLPEHALPAAISASGLDRGEAEKLIGQFDHALGQALPVLSGLYPNAPAAPGNSAASNAGAAAAPADRAQEGDEANTSLVATMRGLCSYCPGVDSLKRMVVAVRTSAPGFSEQLQVMVFARLRTLRFGDADKTNLQTWIQEQREMYSDETVIALLNNYNHPSEQFNAKEIIHMIQVASEIPGPQGTFRVASGPLHTAMRRWLVRLYGRNNAAEATTQQAPAAINQIHKNDIIDPIRQAIEGWHMVLRLKCFRSEEDQARMLLFELSQLYFFKDPEALVVLDCMLELEVEIKQVSVPALESELQRIAIKAARDAQDMAEMEDSEGLLGLLFKSPTQLRFVVIQAFIEFRHASNDLGRILVNKPIWQRLLHQQWRDSKTIGASPLGHTQKEGINLLQTSSARIADSRIQLSTLHTILSHQHVYEDLVAQVTGDRPRQIPERQRTLKQFDDEHTHLRTYTKLFCGTASADTQELSRLLEDIRDNYAQMELKVAAAKFDGLPVRPHLPWLYSLRSSDVFSGIWKETARSKGKSGRGHDNELQNARTEILSQDFVVSTVIPKARKTWEDLAASIEQGTPILKDIQWMQKYEWKKVEQELQLLENTAPKNAPWVPKAVEMAQAMRLAAKLREWAPAVLTLHRVLGTLFHSPGPDHTVAELKQVVKTFENMWDMQLGHMQNLVSPHRATINILKEDMQDYVITAASHDESLEMLLQHKSLDDFNRLIMLCRPNTDDPLILAGIASLQQTRTFLSEVLYSKPPYANVKDFLHELSRLTVDSTVHSALRSVQGQFAPMQELLTSNSRAPGVQACYDLRAISQNGTFHVFCSLKESEQIVCKLPDASGTPGAGREFGYESLQELRRTLLMTDVPEEMERETDLHGMLLTLVEKLQLLEDYGRCTMDLFLLGHFSYSAGQDVLQVPPRAGVETLRQQLQVLQKKLESWQTAVDEARNKHYFLNYFTLRELCFLAKSASEVNNDAEWEKVWTLMRVLNQDAEGVAIRKKVLNWIKGGKLPRAAEGNEASLLDAMGQMMGEIFGDMQPLVRKLEGLKVGARQQHWQGDLLIKSMSSSELNTPIFVCCADNASKVTELVLSIYVRRERVPESEELLLCSHRTTMEEIELLLRRFFTARDHHREERLYCLGNIHLLPYVVQVGTVDALRAFEERFGYARASALVFVSGEPNQMLTNALIRHNISVGLLPEESLRDAVKKVGELYHGRQMQAVAAQMNGVGKTHYILRQVWDLQQECSNQPVLHRVDIRETTTMSSLVATLLADPTDPDTPTAVYVNLAHILPSHVDTLLFGLLIVGMLRDPKNCTAYHRRRNDIFFVEIPNTPQEQTAKQLSFCLLVPRVFLQMTVDRLAPEVPTLEKVATKGGKDALLVTLKDNDSLARVGKTLQAMKQEMFNPKSKHFKPTWVESKEDRETMDRVYNLLDEVCCSESSPPSFLIFTNFMNFLGNLVSCAEKWNMMNLELLQKFDPGLKNFKHCLYRLLIETSRDFALRQVPKQMLVVERSPLAPPRQQGARTTSATRLSPNLSRLGSSRRLGEAGMRTALEEEYSGVGRIDITSYAKRFDQMPAWEKCVHPIATFKKNESGMVIGCNIMSLSKDFLGTFIDTNLQNSLNLNDLKLEKDWTGVTHREAVELVLYVEGGAVLKKKADVSGPADYVVTVDNLLKLMSIQQRLRYGLPVILMGETGCGKTSLVKFLAKTLELKLFTLDIHGGITDEKIMSFLDEAVDKARSDGGVMIFFDEINAANCMALFKTIIIDRVYGNKVIPPTVRMISCCNPYRLRHGQTAAPSAIVFQHHAGEGATGIRDPMRALVYRVHPLPESLIDVVSDFGSLSDKSEELYIRAILEKELPRQKDDPDDDKSEMAVEYRHFMTAFTSLLCASQDFVRKVHDDERSVVSMRDISRAATVCKWFLTYYSKLQGKSLIQIDEEGAGIRLTNELKPHLRSAVILTLGYCYHARLQRDDRWTYRQKIAETWRRELQAAKWLQLDDKDLEEKIFETQNDFVKEMELGEGIALNEALRENLFMLLVSIMNQIPILLIGKPGCSKSLAMGVIQNNLNGEVSKKEFFRSMPAVDVMPYQCSPLSTPEAILNAFQTARFGNLSYKKTIVCVLLDEVGLAEESPHLPLKVLHKELEDLQGIACVGISNWELDAAKMNRCVTLYRPPPTINDLIATAQGMVSGEGLKGWLRALSEAFYEIYKEQSRQDFWGMREFYSTVRVINAEMKKKLDKGQAASLEEQVLMKTVQRNFGGMPENDQFGIEACIDTFFHRCGMDYDFTRRYTTKELIKQNLDEPDARHLMLLTKNNAALRLLFGSQLLDWAGTGSSKQAEVMFGSTFPGDQSDVFVAMNLQRIKSYMQQPISLVMVHCDSLYESLYDLLNQHYMEYGGQRYVRIAHGSKAKQCPVHILFRVIVVVEADDAYNRLAPPLLNRFEKQIFLRKDLMQREDEVLLKRLQKFWEAVHESVQPEGAGRRGNIRYVPVAGFHSELLSSLVFTLRQQQAGKSMEALELEARKMLTWVLMPEAVCIIASRLSASQMNVKFGFNLVSLYFEEQHHSDLTTFTKAMLADKDFSCDPYGSQVMVLTYSPIRSKVGHELDSKLGVKTREVSLHELTSSTDMEKSVRDFYTDAEAAPADKKHVFLIHADPIAASLRMIEHCRFVCERERNNFVTKAKESGNRQLGKAIVIIIVHLQRGWDSTFSFDFDSKWRYAFLDSVEPAQDMSNMPSLGEMLNMPLLEVMRGLDFTRLLKLCFRSSLSRLIYPHSRKPEDLQAQILLILRYLDEHRPFIEMVRKWMLEVLAKTPKRAGEGSVGEDRHWFADIASEAHELALAGTYRMALHNRIVVLISSLFTALLAHLDRNGGLILLETESKRDLWLRLATASLTSPLSTRLHNEAAAAVKEDVAAHHEVGTDALTAARPFQSQMPSSWFIDKSLTALRHAIEPLPHHEQLAGLQQQYERLTTLKEVGLNPVLGPELLEDYLADFTAMHLEWTQGLERDTQTMILKKMLQRLKNGPLHSILEVHQIFWASQKSVAYCVKLLNAVPDAINKAVTLIDTVEPERLNLELLVLVHQALYDEVTNTTEKEILEKFSKKNSPEWGINEFYRDWLRRKRVVSDLTKNFLQTFPNSDLKSLQMLKADYEPRVETLALFMGDVLLPLEAHMQRQVQELRRRVQEVKKDNEAEIKKREEDVKKQQALIPKERVPFQVTLELARELPKGKTRHAQTFLAILRVGQKAAAGTGSMQAKFLEALGAFIESWMLDICLRDAETTSDTEEQCLKLLCGVAVGLQVKIEPHSLQGIVVAGLQGWSDKQEVGLSVLPNKAGSIPRSSSLNLAMMRKLLVTSKDKANTLAKAEIERWLKDIAQHVGHNDSTTATKYAVLCEEDAAEEFIKLSSPTDWPQFQLEQVFDKARESKPHEILRDIGKIRWMLAQYAAVLCDPDLTDDDEISDRHDLILTKVNNLLHVAPGSPHAKVCRSVRIFLLKCMDIAVGSTTVRGALAIPPLSEAEWVVRWRDLHDIDFEKFIGAALVPKWNPFRDMATTNDDKGKTEYDEAKSAVLAVMNTDSCQALENFAKLCTSKSADQQRKFVGALLLALCQEPGLLSALEDGSKPVVWRKKLFEWLRTTKELPINDKVRYLLRLFAGDYTVLDEMPAEQAKFLQPFKVFGGCPMDQLLRWRVLGHLAGALIAAPSTSLLAALRKLMLEPEDFTAWGQSRGSPTFLPGMDEDIRNRVMKALLERGENIWKFKSHWYKCNQCGYSFFIGECGRPMEESSCPNCKAKIGGRDHNATKHTVQDDENDRSPPGYMLPSYDMDEKHVTFREMASSSARLVRVLLHGTMFLGIAAYGKALHSGPVYERLVNKDSMCTMHRGNEAKFIGDHWQNDWKQLVTLLGTNPEDLSALMHSLLTTMMGRAVDKSKGEGGSSQWDRLTMATRNSWEETLDHIYLLNILSNVDQHVQGLYNRWSGGEEDGKFVAELKERADVRDYPVEKRRDEMPQLWASRAAVNLDALHARIGVERNPTELYPVLLTILQVPLFPTLQALACLVGVFEWHALINNHLSGRITRQRAGTLTIREFLSELAQAERPAWEAAFNQFEKAWTIAWKYVTRHECMELAENLKQIQMSRDTKLIWAIVDHSGEGICATALTQFLVERHNELAQVVNAARGDPMRRVSSRMLAQHDSVTFTSVDLEHFLRSRCVTYGVAGKLNFDLLLLEQYLRTQLARPEITMEVRTFHWLGESFSFSAMELKEVIKQRELSQEIRDRLANELQSKSLANACLQKVQMSVSFILKSGGALGGEAGEMLLSEYLRTILCETEDVLLSPTARAEVHLWHVDNFVKLLQQLIGVDPMEGVDLKYRESLPEDLAQKLTTVRPTLPASLAEQMAGLAGYLREATIGAETKLFDMLAQADFSDADQALLTEKLQPIGFLMKHWVEVFRAVNK